MTAPTVADPPSARSRRGAARSSTGRGFQAGPRVSLLPRELKSAKRSRRVKRLLVFAVVLVALGVGYGIYELSTVAQTAQQRAVAADAPSVALRARLAKYAPINALEAKTGVSIAAARVGSSTQIDWRALVHQIEGAMPKAFTLTGVVTQSASPVADFEQGTTLLDAPRAGAVTITATSPSIATLPTFLAKLPAVKGYADATPSLTKDGSGYTVTITMHITTKAYITPLTTKVAK